MSLVVNWLSMSKYRNNSHDRYPLFVHLENHCSVKQQKVVAHVLKETFGSALYIPAANNPHHQPEGEPHENVSFMSPETLIGKIVISVRQSVVQSLVSFISFQVFNIYQSIASTFPPLRLLTSLTTLASRFAFINLCHG